MLTLLDRVAKTAADLTIGIVIVFVHSALVRHESAPRRPARSHSLRDGTRVWTSQVSP
jgi:hypothetical protein